MYSLVQKPLTGIQDDVVGRSVFCHLISFYFSDDKVSFPSGREIIQEFDDAVIMTNGLKSK